MVPYIMVVLAQVYNPYVITDRIVRILSPFLFLSQNKMFKTKHSHGQTTLNLLSFEVCFAIP
jgi:hypothetical protein